MPLGVKLAGVGARRREGSGGRGIFENPRGTYSPIKSPSVLPSKIGVYRPKFRGTTVKGRDPEIRLTIR